MALEGKEISALTDSELKAVQDALKITDINDYLTNHGLKYVNKTVDEVLGKTNFDEMVVTGFYRVGNASNYTNFPSDFSGFGQLIISRVSSSCFQLYAENSPKIKLPFVVLALVQMLRKDGLFLQENLT